MNRNSIPRLLIYKDLITDLKIELSLADQHYLKVVLRLKKGDIVNVFDGKNGEWKAVIEDNKISYLICKKQIKLQKKKSGPSIYFSLIKNNNMRWLIEKSTELGVKELCPLITERTNNKYFNEKKAQMHIKEACEVSERVNIPVLKKITTLKKILELTDKNSDNLIFCNESRKDNYLQDYLSNNYNDKTSFLIGPEGGFSPEEEALIKSYKHVSSVKLTDRILRAETAAIMALSIFYSFKERL